MIPFVRFSSYVADHRGGGAAAPLSNLDKVLYPATGTTKGEVLHYCASTADALLAICTGGPVFLLRYPDGPDGQLFFTKNLPPGTPSWVTTAEVTALRRRDRARCWSRTWRALMWAANLVVEFHTPQWRSTHRGAPTGSSSISTPGRPPPSWTAATVAAVAA